MQLQVPGDAQQGVRSPTAPPDITITVEGVSYTLQPSRLQIVVSTGGIIEVPEGMLGSTLDAFIADLDDKTTAVEAGLQGAGYYAESKAWPTTELGQRDRDPRPSATEPHWGVDPSSVQVLHLSASRGKAIHPKGKYTMRRKGKGKQLSHVAVTSSHTTDRSPLHLQTTFFTAAPVRPSAAAGLYSDPESCVDISRSIYDVVREWRAARDEFHRELGGLLDIMTIDPTTGTLKVKRPEMENAVSYDQASYGLMTKQIQLNYLAIQYERNGCMNNLWTDNSVYAGSGSSTASGQQLVCRPEQWEISFDGGETWEPITVSVCEFAQT